MSTELATIPTELAPLLEKRNIDEALWSAISNSIFPGAKDESKLMAYDYCNARQLDILKKPIHIVPMNVKNSQTGNYEWRDVIMPGIADHRITATRSGEYGGQDAPVFGPMVDLQIGKDTHSVPEYCTVTIYRFMKGERVPIPHTEYFDEACGTVKAGGLNSMWTKRKRGQLAKCAEAGALRKAFPEELGGVITADEAIEDINNDELKPAKGKTLMPKENPTIPALADSEPDAPTPEEKEEVTPSTETTPEEAEKYRLFLNTVTQEKSGSTTLYHVMLATEDSREIKATTTNLDLAKQAKELTADWVMISLRKTGRGNNEFLSIESTSQPELTAL